MYFNSILIIISRFLIYICNNSNTQSNNSLFLFFGLYCSHHFLCQKIRVPVHIYISILQNKSKMIW